MPVFWLLVILALILIWACLAFVFKPIGRLGKSIAKDVVDAVTKEDKKDFDIIDKE